MNNQIFYYDENFSQRNSPDYKPWMRYAIMTNGACFIHEATFDTMAQLQQFANELGFKFTFSYKTRSGETDREIKSGHDFYTHGPFDDECNAYGISPESLKVAKKFKSLSNGSIVDNYFVNDGMSVRIYRCNPNAKKFFHPLPLQEHIYFQKQRGIF